MNKPILELIKLPQSHTEDFEVKFNMSETTFMSKYAKNNYSISFKYNNKTLIISSRCCPYIDYDIVWIKPKNKYLHYFNNMHMSDSELLSLINAFNLEYRPCCDSIRLCNICLKNARDIISF